MCIEINAIIFFFFFFLKAFQIPIQSKTNLSGANDILPLIYVLICVHTDTHVPAHIHTPAHSKQHFAYKSLERKSYTPRFRSTFELHGTKSGVIGQDGVG